MAHTVLHFSVGLAVGTAVPLAPVVRNLVRAERKAGLLRLWIGAAYAAGLFACVPNVLRSLGIPEQVCAGWWMNIFMLHPLIDALEDGGMLVGEILLAACFTLQYLVLLLTLRSIRMRSDPGSDTS